MISSRRAAERAEEYAYQYDDIGSRITSLDLGTNHTYTANSLNQYTQISNLCDSASLREEFIPVFDLDGNQTLIKTATGVWQVTYNGENRPAFWSCGTTNIIMKFDRMGRRVEYVETVSGVTNTHHRFVYDGYLCIQRLNGAANNSIDLVFGWDPSEPVATRPLILQKYGAYNLFYTHDGNKNVSDIVSYQSARGVPAHYEYAPFGAVTAATTNTAFTAFNVATTNPFRFSSEYADDALGLVYYNYRHYEPVTGRWCSRDRVSVSEVYLYLRNNVPNGFDKVGNVAIISKPVGDNSNRQPSNCLGGAMTGKGNQYRYPCNNQPGGKPSEWSFVKAMIPKGWLCRTVSSRSECVSKKCFDKILITLYVNKNPKNQGKDPWNDADFNWQTLNAHDEVQTDIHAIRENDNGEYEEIPSYSDNSQEFRLVYDFTLFDAPDNPLLCCYKRKVESSRKN